MKKKLSGLFLCIMLLASTGLFAQSTYYEKGNTSFSFTAGITAPFFFHFWTGENNHPDQWYFFSNDMNTYVGGYAAISYMAFTNERWAFGGELGYSFNYDKGDHLYYNVPLMAKVAYYPIQTGKFDLYLTAGLGLAYNHYTSNNLTDVSQGLLSPYANLGIGGMYFFNDNWGLGLETGVDFIPQISFYQDTAQDNGTFATIPVVLKVTYRN